jgi:hypothetical protein
VKQWGFPFSTNKTQKMRHQDITFKVNLKNMFMMHNNVCLFSFYLFFFVDSVLAFLLPEAALTLAFKASRSKSLLNFFWLGPASSGFPESSLGGLKDLPRLASRLIADSA